MTSLDQKIKPSKDKLGIKPIIISYKGDDPDVAKNKLNSVSSVPTVYYYGIELPANAIKELTVDSNKFMPLCYLCFSDIYNMLGDIGFPADNAKLTVVLPTNDANLGQLFMDFKITKYEVELGRGNDNKKIHFWGICNVEEILIQEYKAYKDQSTFDLMKLVSGNSGMGFVSNTDGTKDKQTWLNTGMEGYNFLQDTIHKAWNGESSYMWGFVDLYYNLNYLDVELALSQNIKELNWYTNSIINRSANGVVETKSNKVQPFLTNDLSTKNSNVYFTGEKILNQSTDTSLKRGYLRSVHFYDKDGNWADKAGKYKTYDLDTITSQNTQAQSIILKGEPGKTDFYSKNKKNYYMGYIDTKNSYVDFLWAKMQNSENLYDLQKICMQITLPQVNFNIRRFEKIKIRFSQNNVSPINTNDNFKLNGEWLCVGIQFKWDGNSLIQKVNIVKREITINDL
jgi:hypothetical protein